MNRVEELEKAIQQLSPQEFSEIARWVADRDQERWDEQMDRDAASGKLDFVRQKHD